MHAGFHGRSRLACFLRINQSDAMAEMNQPLSEELQEGGFAGSPLADQRVATILLIMDIAQSLVRRISRILYTLPLSTRTCIESLV